MKKTPQENSLAFRKVMRESFNAIYSSIVNSGYDVTISCVTDKVKGLPSELYRKPVVTLNASGDAIGEMSQDENYLYLSLRFDGKHTVVSIDFVGVLGISAFDKGKVIFVYPLASGCTVMDQETRDFISKSPSYNEDTQPDPEKPKISNVPYLKRVK